MDALEKAGWIRREKRSIWPWEKYVEYRKRNNVGNVICIVYKGPNLGWRKFMPGTSYGDLYFSSKEIIAIAEAIKERGYEMEDK